MDIHVINKLKFSLSNPPFISFIIGIFALLFAFYLQYILGMSHVNYACIKDMDIY